MNEKVRHVRNATQTRRHTCHWPGCNTLVPPAMWGCRPHWFTLPQHLRNAIWRVYVPGQEERNDPSVAYIAAAKAAQQWIAEHETRLKQLRMRTGTVPVRKL